MRRRQTFVVFADDWGRHPSSCQHLFRRIAPHHRVVWVNTIGTRTPTLSRADLARAAEKLREWMGGGDEDDGEGEEGDEAVEKQLADELGGFDDRLDHDAISCRVPSRSCRTRSEPSSVRT